MSRATLLVIHGPNRGTRYVVEAQGDTVIGRSVGSNIRLDDGEVSRRHALIRYDGRAYVLNDLQSANGTRCNGRRIESIQLRHGDSVRVGSSLLSFQQVGANALPRESVENVTVVEDDDDRSGDHSAIVQSVSVQPGSSLTVQQTALDASHLLFRIAEELVRPTHSLESLLNRILDLTLIFLGADRGCVLLREPSTGKLRPIAFQRRGEHASKEPLNVSGTITSYVLKNGQAVRTSDARADDRFGGQSIASSGVREAICAPMKGQEEMLGVFYVDTQSDGVIPGGSRLTDDHLTAVLAIARQSALAVEARHYQDAFLKAERFAAMGQTVAVLSHHIKNILQGMRGGGFLIRKGLEDGLPEMAQQGWSVVERNQERIYELVTDMLSFSRERIPQVVPADLNAVCGEISDLGELRANESEVDFTFHPDLDIPLAAIDPEAIHRAVLNIVSNAIDAVHQTEGGAVVMQTGYDAAADMMIVAVSDNGPGIPEDQRDTVFNVFESSKGSRGTGIGLAVSLKIVREHGGRIRIEGEPGQGTRFVLAWPRGNPESLSQENLHPGTAGA